MTAIYSLSKLAPVVGLAAALAACDRPAPPSDAGVAVQPSEEAPMPPPVTAAPPPSASPPPAPAPDAPPPPASTPPPATTPPAAPAPARWTVSRSRQGAVATLASERGVLLTFSCLASPPRLRVNVPGFRPVASEDRMSIGFGNDPIALAANLNARGEGVTARGELPANISGRILRGRTISVNYGSQNAGPFDALRGQDAMTMANACAEAAAPPTSPGPTPGDPADNQQQIPVNFRGEWNTRLQDCGTGRNDSRLRIDAGTVRFYESQGAVTGVTRHGPRSITVDARYRGEGETWNRSTRMSLSGGGDQLTIDSMTRQRCPTTAQGRPGERPPR